MGESPADDPAFLARLRDGEEAAFARLVEDHQDRIARFLYRMLGPGGDIEDAAQVVFTKAFLSIGSFREEVSLESWLYRIARNHAIDRLRRKKARPERTFASLSEDEQVHVEEHVAAPGDDPSERAEATERSRAAFEALSKISEDDRALLILKEVEGKSLEEISKITGASVGALKVRVFRARQRLKKAAVWE
ncbi:MAG: sigma-70 family RNA polymerase sigma factor [Bdellovibrionota bacterium]